MHPLAACGRVKAAGMLIPVGALIIAVVLPPFFGVGVPRLAARWRNRPVRPDYVMWLATDAGGLVGDAQERYWVVMIVHLASAAVALWLWWRSRRGKRKRAPRALGAKSRERVARLVRGMRDAQRPRRVWQPQPGGAGW